MKTIDIVDAINARLTEKWPARTVYLDVCPVDFDRPSFWLQVTKDDRSDANRYTDRRAVQIALTAYDEKDEHYESSWQRLSGVVDECLTLLGGVLKVGDRRFKPTLKSLPREPDRVSILLDFSFMAPRAGDGGTEEKADTLVTSLTVNGKKI